MTQTENADRHDVELQGRLVEVQRLEHGRRWATHLSRIVLTMAVLISALTICDYYLELAPALRGVGLLLVLAASIVLVIRARRHSPYATAEAAADVESTFPHYGQRLRTTLDYAEQPRATAPASPNLLKALNAQTRRISAVDDFRQATSPRSLYAGIAACLFLFAVCSLLLLIVPELRLAAGRILLLPVDYTSVSLSQIEQPIAVDDDLTIEIEVRGRPAREALVRFRRAETNDIWTEMPLLPPDTEPDDPSITLRGVLTATLVECQHDLELEVLAGPRHFPMQRIRVLQPLELTGFEAIVQPPAYTGRESESFHSETFSVWEGSLVNLQFEMDPSPAHATLRPEPLVDSKKKSAEAAELMTPIELTIRGNLATAQLPDVRQSLRFTLEAKTVDGVTLDSPRYRIRVKLDKKPEIHFVSPEDELEVIATTEVPLAIQAGDDVGVTKVGLLYKLSDGDVRTLWEQDYTERPDSLHATETLFLEDHQLTYQDAVTYYAFAEDRYFDEARRVTTPLRFIDVRPFKRSFEVTEAPGGS